MLPRGLRTLLDGLEDLLSVLIVAKRVREWHESALCGITSNNDSIAVDHGRILHLGSVNHGIISAILDCASGLSLFLLFLLLLLHTVVRDLLLLLLLLFRSVLGHFRVCATRVGWSGIKLVVGPEIL